MSGDKESIHSIDSGLVVETRENVASVAGDMIAVQVYRELQRRNQIAKAAGCSIIGNCSNGSCDIIGNCSSSSAEILQKTVK